MQRTVHSPQVTTTAYQQDSLFFVALELSKSRCRLTAESPHISLPSECDWHMPKSGRDGQT
jgi:hypothetical protein